jgi:hypothetical protein
MPGLGLRELTQTVGSLVDRAVEGLREAARHAESPSVSRQNTGTDNARALEAGHDAAVALPGARSFAVKRSFILTPPRPVGEVDPRVVQELLAEVAWLRGAMEQLLAAQGLAHSSQATSP